MSQRKPGPAGAVWRGWTLALILIGTGGGCGSRNPYAFASPPVVAAPGVTDPNATPPPPMTGRETIIVVGEFENPDTSSLRWRDIGPGLSDALGRTMFGQGRHDIRLRPDLVREVDRILRGSPARRSRELSRVSVANPEVDYVLLGQVTDFVHMRDLNPDLGRRDFFGGRKKEAFVALKLDLVDLQTQRVIAIGHLYGAARADDHPTPESYKNVRISNYLFWSTPLGKASTQAINRAIDHMNTIIPAPIKELHIVQKLEPRVVQINGGTDSRVARGDRFYILHRHAPGANPEPVLDSDTGLPLQLRVDHVNASTSSAWIMGVLPPDVRYHATILQRQLPAPESESEAESGGAGTISAEADQR